MRQDPLLEEALRLVQEDFFSQLEPGIFEPLCDSLIWHDEFMVFADFEDYIFTQEKVSQAYLDHDEWTGKSIMNTARSGRFSSDRTVGEYAKDIWGVGV